MLVVVAYGRVTENSEWPCIVPAQNLGEVISLGCLAFHTTHHCEEISVRKAEQSLPQCPCSSQVPQNVESH